jgi:hypothetical protein
MKKTVVKVKTSGCGINAVHSILLSCEIISTVPVDDLVDRWAKSVY